MWAEWSQVGSPFNGAVLHLVAEALMATATCREGCTLEFPRGGSQAIINALVRCLPQRPWACWEVQLRERRA